MKLSGRLAAGVLLGALFCGMLFFAAKSGGTTVPAASVPQEKMRGVWVATAANLDFPSAPDLAPAALAAELDAIVEHAASWGLNALFFQVRPNCDALYASSLFPVSKALSSTGALPGDFDPLAYLVRAAHQKGVAVHAWINPFRLLNAGSPDDLPENSPGKTNPEWVVSYADGKFYLDPGQPQVRRLVIDGVREIIENYEVDGIHLDDYFYPYPVSDAVFDDSASFETFADGRDREDFRRDNITDLIRELQAVIRAKNEKISFGVSPFAVWQNASTDPAGSRTSAGVETYGDLYADTRLWVKEGLIDYICPQIYWSRATEAAPYETVLNWWEDTVRDTPVCLYVGHAVYKVGRTEYGWDDKEEIPAQLARSAAADGDLFFRYGSLKENPLGVTDRICAFYGKNETAS